IEVSNRSAGDLDQAIASSEAQRGVVDEDVCIAAIVEDRGPVGVDERTGLNCCCKQVSFASNLSQFGIKEHVASAASDLDRIRTRAEVRDDDQRTIEFGQI